MNTKNKTSRNFVLLAGGVGARFGGKHPKQLSMLAGKTVLEHSVQNISRYKDLDEIIVVARSAIKDKVIEIVDKLGDTRFRVVEGGDNRLASTLRGIEAIDAADDSDVLIHDAVRPFLSHEIIDNCWAVLERYDAVDVVVPSTDTVVHVDESQTYIQDIPNRSQYYRGQTPQGFKLGMIKQAYGQIDDVENAPFTDDCGLFLSVFPNSKIGIALGDEDNIKITYPRDLFIAEQIIKAGIGTAEATSDEDKFPLDQLVVAVLGGNSGLGEDLVNQLNARGATVYSGSRSNGVDVKDKDQLAAFFQKIEDEAGRLDVVVNSAGILDMGRLPEMKDESVVDSVMINYLGAINSAKQAYPFLRRSKGQLILFSSSSYYRGRQDYSVYSSSKAAVVNLTQALAEEWADEEIRVNCIVPRRANTPMRHKAFPGEDPNTLLQPEQVTQEIITLLEHHLSGLVVHVY